MPVSLVHSHRSGPHSSHLPGFLFQFHSQELNKIAEAGSLHWSPCATVSLRGSLVNIRPRGPRALSTPWRSRLKRQPRTGPPLALLDLQGPHICLGKGWWGGSLAAEQKTVLDVTLCGCKGIALKSEQCPPSQPQRLPRAPRSLLTACHEFLGAAITAGSLGECHRQLALLKQTAWL